MNKADNPLLRPSNPFESRTVRAIAQAKPNLASPGVCMKTLPGGTSLMPRGRPRNRALTPPLHVSLDGRVKPGTIGNVMPEISGVPLDDDHPRALNIPSSGTRYVVIEVTGTLNKQFNGGAIFCAAAMTEVSVVIKLSTTRPTDEDLVSTEGSFKIPLATFVDGAKTAQNGHGPITLLIQDKLDGSGTGVLVVGWTNWVT